MKRILTVTLSLAMLALVFTSVGMARPAVNLGESVQIMAPDPGSVAPIPNNSAREDTLWLFAASGPGSYGTPGTVERGWSFDWFNPGTQENEAAPGGWYGFDNTEQLDFYWHVADVAICAGTDTDMSAALPFDGGDPDNSYAAWCGVEDVCGWEHPIGYGNNWNQWMRVNLASSSNLNIDFAYSSYFEGTQWDYFQLFVEEDGVLTEELLDNTEGPTGFLQRNVNVTGNLGRVVFSFLSDGAWCDQDNLFPTNVGAVWIDNIVIDADAVEVLAEDFEDGVADPMIEFTAPAGAGDFAALYENLPNDDPCNINTSFAWAFFDSLTLNPEYGNHPVIPYGPPYVENYVVSPVLEVDQTGRVLGSDLILDESNSVYLDFWVKDTMDFDALIFWKFEVAARAEGQNCLGRWTNDQGVWYHNSVWDRWIVNVTEYLMDSAEGGTITGIAARLGVIDMCPYWCDSQGSGDSHPPEPYFDNVSLTVLEASPITWRYNEPDRFQDNFPDHTGPFAGFVRMDHAGDYDWSDEGVPVSIVDSTVVGFNADLDGFVSTTDYGGDIGVRSDVFMYWRIVAGPNAGDITGASGDPFVDGYTDLAGNCYSPWLEAVELFPGEFWNKAVCSDAYYGTNPNPVENTWAFDLNDAFFLPGDELEIFFQGFSGNGNSSTIPTWALSADEDLRSYYTVRCLPSGNSTLLFVEDDRSLFPFWREAFRYNGYESYDRFYTQAPSSGQSNGLASRAELDDIAGYDCIIWDSGNIPTATVCDEDDKTRDDLLLTNWIDFAAQPTYAWFLGDKMANDLAQGDPFLTGILGANLVESSIYYDDRTGIVVPLVCVTYEPLPRTEEGCCFWVDGGCPNPAHFALVAPADPFAETFLEWDVDPGDNAKAGILNNDPDGNGQPYNDQGSEIWTKVLFNPWSYFHARDAGYGIPAGIDCARYYVSIALGFLGHPGSGPVDIPDPPLATMYRGAYPNPFNPTTKIAYSLAEAGPMMIHVYDVTGRCVRTLWDGPQTAGEHEIKWKGRDENGNELASGVYFLRFRAGKYERNQKLVLLK